MELNEAWYHLPQGPVTTWPMPPPCAADQLPQPYLGRYLHLLKYIITSNLLERGLQYSIESVSVDSPLASCRVKTECFVTIGFSLPEGMTIQRDGKRAAKDIVMYAPREVQKVTANKKSCQLTNNARWSPVIVAEYVPNCRHNVGGQGNAVLLPPAAFPRVCQDVQ